MKLDPLELAWAAGFYDGEGSAATSVGTDTNRVVFNISVSQTDTRPLERFRRAVGGLGYIYGPFQRSMAHHKPLWQYRTSRFEHSQAVMAMLWRFLCEPKREQFTAAVLRHREHATIRFRYLQAGECPIGHPREFFALGGDGRVRCRECQRESYYRRLGREVPPRAPGIGRPRLHLADSLLLREVS